MKDQKILRYLIVSRLQDHFNIILNILNTTTLFLYLDDSLENRRLIKKIKKLLKSILKSQS